MDRDGGLCNACYHDCKALPNHMRAHHHTSVLDDSNSSEAPAGINYQGELRYEGPDNPRYITAANIFCVP
eukprot:9267912-Pyramimonas_sp.AAC.1